MQRGNITINEASFAREAEMIYSMEQTEQLLGNLQLDEVSHGNIIKYKITVNNMPVNVLYDIGTLMSCMAKQFSDTLAIKPKLIPCDRYIAGEGGKTLRQVGECFVKLQIGKGVF